MKTVPFLLIFVLLFSVAAHGEVKTWPAPENEKVVGVYSVTVNGQPVDVYAAQSEFFDGDYCFAYFDFSESVQVEIRSAFPMAKTRILPERFGLKPEVSAESVKFEAKQPFRISVEPNGRVRPLILFGNALESDVPDPKASNVVFFGPGVHHAGKVELASGQTLYLAGGAVLHGAIHASGENITIRGRGVLAGETWKRFAGPGFPLTCRNCRNLVIRDLIIRNPWNWTATTWDCDGVLIDGLKICSSRMINDDALDLVNTKNVVVRNCFFRTQDDSIAIKGCDREKHLPCENIRIEDCQFWTDCANIYRIGYECDADGMRNIVSKRIDVLHYSKNFHDENQYWANSIFWLQPNLNMMMEDCHFEDVTVYSDGSPVLMLMAKPMRCVYGPHKKPEPGTLRNCSFKNVRVVGEPGGFNGRIFIQGESGQWNVSGLTFDGVTYFGTPVTRDSSCVKIGNFAENIKFQ